MPAITTTHDSHGFEPLVAQVRACRLCAAHLPLDPRPIFQLDPRARILVAAQAPGLKAHDRNRPFDDASGDRLRAWMGIDRASFYDPTRIAILPMGFCFPGTGRNGDLPPRPECAPAWRARLLAQLPDLTLTLLIGKYAQAWHLHGHPPTSVTEVVARWRDLCPAILPLPHPSPRNQRWLRDHPWFERDVLPQLRARVHALL